MCEIVKKNTVEWNFPKLEISILFNLSKIYSASFFLIFPVSTSVCNEKIVIKKYGVTGSVFMTAAIDGKSGSSLLLCNRTVLAIFVT